MLRHALEGVRRAGREVQEAEGICIPVAEALSHTAETNMVL